ncbi:MAG: hypothetical protein ABJD24_01640 [Acidimicrobiales bacterium]
MTVTESSSAPRTIEFVTVKRNLPLTWRSYGHWWIEMDGEESYGWWPAQCPVGVLQAFKGTGGILNGMGVTEEGTSNRDPNHGLPADYEFHPVLISEKTDDTLRNDMRHYAHSFTGEWRWSTRPTMNCRLFQLDLFDAVGLVDGTGNYHTRGEGCPALRTPRRVAARLTGRRRWPGNLPRPGQRVGDISARRS